MNYLVRYSRQITVPGFGVVGQRRLLESRALIIGLGGLGSPAAMYLAASGVGTLVLSDFDRVEESNLQRQIIHSYADIGGSKVHSAQRTLKGLNPECVVITKEWELDEAELAAEIHQADVVLDCSDNFATRFALNRACVIGNTPLVSGATVREEGQVITFFPHQGPCYQCLYPITAEPDTGCISDGVLAPLVGVIGSMQSLQAIKVLIGQGASLTGRLLIFDAIAMTWRAVRVPKDSACAVCGDT